MKRINWGMIGTGDVTEKKSGPAFNKVKGSRLVAVYNRTHSKAVSYAARHQIPRVYEQADELINDPEINAIYVATPPQSHADYAIRIMEAGKPVYVEKPMSRTFDECRRMNEVSTSKGIPLFVAYYRRSLEYFIKIREIFEGKVLGDILFVNASLHQTSRPEDRDPDRMPWRVKPEVSGGGYFHDMASHELDLLVYFFGRFKKISGHAANRAGLYEPADTVAASGIFKQGILFAGSWCFACDHHSSVDEIIVTGTRGVLKFSCFDFSPIQLYVDGNREHFNIERPEIIQLPMIRSVTEELQGTGVCPSHGDSAAYVNWLMEEILS